MSTATTPLDRENGFAKTAGENKRIIFVVGNSRSGTTMMARLLGNHSAIYAFNELHFFEEIFSTEGPDELLDHDEAVELLAGLLGRQFDGYHVWAKADKWHSEASQILGRQTGETLSKTAVLQIFFAEITGAAGKRIPLEQTPRNLLFLDTILSLWPNARVVEMVRDPRDVMLSQKNRWRRVYLAREPHGIGMSFRAWTNYHPLITPRIWRSSVRTGARYSGDPRVLRIVFEKLIADPAAVLDKLMTFLELEVESALFDVSNKGSSAAKDQGETGFNANAVGRWQQGGLSHTELALCEKICAVEMDELGYARCGQKGSAAGVLAAWVLLPLKLGLAGLANLGRSSNMLASFRRRIADDEPATQGDGA